MPQPTAVGDLTTVSLTPETTAGVFDGGATPVYLFTYSAVTPAFDPKLIDVRVNTRNPIRVRAQVPTLGEPKYQCSGPISSDLMPVLPLLGTKIDGTGLQAPSPVSILTGFESVDAHLMAGMFCVRQTYTWDPVKEAMYQFDFDGITPPVLVGSIAAPSLTMGDPYVFSHLDPANLIGQNGRLDLQALSVVIDFIHAKAPGNTKKAAYAFMRFNEEAVSFSVTVLHRNGGEYNAMLASTPGAFLFSATQPSPSTASLSFVIPRGKYISDTIEGRDNQFVKEPLLAKAEDPAGVTLINVTMTA